jgi:hypothetical protein
LIIYEMGTVPKTGSTAGKGLVPSSILAIIAGALLIAGIIVGAFILWGGNGMMTSPYMMDGGGMMSDSFMSASIWGVGAIWAGTGAVSILGGYAIYRNPQRATTWGIAILIASIVGLITVGGFIIGPILGIIAGILALVRK